METPKPVDGALGGGRRYAVLGPDKTLVTQEIFGEFGGGGVERHYTIVLQW